MKVLLVGHGAREHAIADALCRSVHEPKLFAIMSSCNPGIYRLCLRSGGKFFRGSETDPKFVADVAEQISADFVFIGPEEPQFHGVPDELWKRGIPCVGATEKCSEIERSKAFMRRLMWKYKIPGRLRFKAFRNVEDALAYIREYAESVALKPARQAGGKGVKVIADLKVYLSEEKRKVKEKHVIDIAEKHMKKYTDIEDRILIEEKVEGPEYTLQAFTDGKTLKPLPVVQDNKNAYEADIGPETGGMGSISGPGMLLPFLTQEEYDRSVEIVDACLKALQQEVGETYKGTIAGQMMLTPLWGPTIIEFYSRFGDPENVNVLPIMQTDMVDICEAILRESLHKIKLEFEECATVVKAIAPKGYPDRRDLAKGHPAHVDEKAIEEQGGKVFYGALDLREDGNMYTTGSRMVEIFAKAETIPEASKIAERCIPYVRLLDGWGLFHRSDIGSEVLLRRRIEQAELIRGVYQYRMQKGLIGVTIDWIPGRGKIVYEA